MKRILVLAVSLAVLGLSSSALAGALAGSEHDFTLPPYNAGRLCVTCHVPHKPVRNVPLWAHELTTATYDLYDQNVGAGTAGAYDASPANLAGTSSQLCLSCHDGSLAVVGIDKITETEGGWILWNDGVAAPVDIANHSTGLKGSHPIGVDYATVRAAKVWGYAVDPELNGKVHLENGKVQCTSCHSRPHGSTTGDKFMAMPNNDSVCTECHLK